jgi:hypothetical protein
MMEIDKPIVNQLRGREGGICIVDDMMLYSANLDDNVMKYELHNYDIEPRNLSKEKMNKLVEETKTVVEDEYIKKIIPASGRASDYVFQQPKRMKNESFEEYKIRRKIDTMMFKLRKVQGCWK